MLPAEENGNPMFTAEEKYYAAGVTVATAVSGLVGGIINARISCPYEWGTEVDDNTHQQHSVREPEDGCFNENLYLGATVGAGLAILVFSGIACARIASAQSSQGRTPSNDMQAPLLVPRDEETAVLGTTG